MQRKRGAGTARFSGGVTELAGGDIQIFHTEPIMCPDREAEQLKKRKCTVVDSLTISQQN